MRGRSGSVAVVAAIAILAAIAAHPAHAAGAAAQGAPGVGDPFFPTAGNGGYDVGHYSLELRYRPQRRRLRGLATVTATATQALSRFNLDLRRLRVSRLRIDGTEAGFRAHAGELIITPQAPLAAGERFTVTVGYRGRPRPVREADGLRTGWLTTPDGAFVLSEPRGAPSWFPCNDHPIDKATYRLRVTVPRGLKAVANGTLEKRRHGARGTTFVWSESSPMATYLATVAIGRFELRRSVAGGVPSWVAVDSGHRGEGALRKTGAILDRFASAFGPYPFESTGAILDRVPDLGVALETQSRPLYLQPPHEAIVVHELAHQWFGDSVSLERWRDIWLNEGFATWAQWLWLEQTGGPSAEQVFQSLYEIPASEDGFWNPPPGDPRPAELFALSVYIRGGMTLQALRGRVGDDAFFRILRRWAAEHAYGNASTEDFIALAESEAGIDLEGFFSAWLYEQGKPAGW